MQTGNNLMIPFRFMPFIFHRLTQVEFQYYKGNLHCHIFSLFDRIFRWKACLNITQSEIRSILLPTG